ncbi:MAG: HAD family phosphatase [Bacteroidales bacterium]|nr:HAD family phosphatase [Bacteroidales bacterium]
MQITTIAFDLGGVVVALNMENAAKRFKELGVKDPHSFLNPFQQGGFFGDLEGGRIDAEGFRQELGKYTGREMTYEECSYACMGFIESVPQRNLEAVRKLRSLGYRVILLSNTNPYVMKWAMSPAFDGNGHALRDYFDACYLSYECKLMKPAEAYFQLVLDHEKVEPGRMLFLDDGPRNLEVARQFGIRTMLVQDNADWTREIFEILQK